MSTVLIMAGGTGGHVFPALVVAEVLRARGVEVRWLGTRAGIEARLVPAAGFPVDWCSVSGLRGKGWTAWLAAPLNLLRALVEAWRALRRARPLAVLGMGGFVSGPGGLAAWLCRVPLVIHEQNAVPGTTNRLLAPLARHVFEAFPGAFARAGVECVGNPVRPAIAALAAARAAAPPRRTRLLVIGGSQGAAALNTALPAALAALAAEARPEVWHQAGERWVEATRRLYAHTRIEARVEPFIDDMAAAYAWADLVVCRAGAMTIAELATVGLPSVLVPLPTAIDDHQTHNARYLADAGAAVLLPQAELTPTRLAAELARLAGDPQLRARMADAARSRAMPDAALRIADALLATGHEEAA